MPVGFTTEQIGHICYQIGEWYLGWRDKIANYEQKTHRLGFAKEQLKDMICGDEYTNNSDTHKTKVELMQEKIDVLQNCAIVLGIVHGGIHTILASTTDNEQIRAKLTDLYLKLSTDINELFYKDQAESSE